MPSKSGTVDLGKAILAARIRRGLSQGVLSRRSGLDPSYLSRIEHGKVRPSIETTTRVARALRVPLTDLLGLPSGGEKSGHCPVSASGQCLLDLLQDGLGPHETRPKERYSPRQVRLLRMLASLLRRGEPKELAALETILLKMLGKEGTEEDKEN